MMKRNLTWLCSLVLFASVLTINFTSCVDDPCENVACTNGTCFDGECVCDVGFIIDPVTGDCIPADPCDAITCGDNSTCIDGDCICDTGFEDDGNGGCVEVVAKFIGNYNATEEDCGVTDPYTIAIEQVAGEPNGIFLKNLGNYGCFDQNGDPINYDVYATIDGSALSINNDETCSIVFNGSGSLDGNTITISYSATYDPGTGVTTDNCTAVLIRQ